MNDTDKRDENFSPELLHAIAADEVGCFTDLPLLSPGDTAVLKQILRGEKRPPISIDKKRAVSALARSERSAEASEILARLVADSKETTQVRAAAAAQLRMMPREAVEKVLTENLETDNEIVRREVRKSLTAVGRLNTRSAVRWTTQAVKQIEGSVVQEKAKSIWGAAYDISLNAELGFEIECGTTKLTMLLNDEIKRGGFVKSALSRQMLAGLVVAEEPEFRHLTVRYLIMTSPSENGLDVTVTRTNGEVAFVGEVRAEGERHRLSLRDVGLERIPTEITGILSDNSIELNVRALRALRRPKKHAVPIATRSAAR